MVGLVNRVEAADTSRTSLHLKNGAHLGKYRLKRYLDIGGACEVWEARDSAEGFKDTVGRHWWVVLRAGLRFKKHQKFTESALS
jgi:hypothetical protein